MADGNSAELLAKWVAAENAVRFRELLNAETEEGKYKILAQLLSYEIEQLKERRAANVVPLPNPQAASRYR